MLQVESLRKSYGERRILQDIRFSLNPGEIFGLAGENGAGKSTLLNILATLLTPDAGHVSLNGLDYADHQKQVRSHIGFVPQELAIWDELSVEENMRFFEKLSWKKQSRDVLRGLCQGMQLDKWKEKAGSLSGGQKRKLNLAISLIHEPDLLLLDEPTVGIDMRSKKEITAYLKELAASRKTMILYTSHDMDEIRELCSQVICIGKDPFYRDMLKAAGKPIQVF